MVASLIIASLSLFFFADSTSYATKATRRVLSLARSYPGAAADKREKRRELKAGRIPGGARERGEASRVNKWQINTSAIISGALAACWVGLFDPYLQITTLKTSCINPSSI